MRPLQRWAVASAALFLVSANILGQGAPSKPAEKGAAVATAPKWIGPDGQPLPWKSDAEVEEFLKKASIGKTKGTSKGITRPSKMELSRDGVRANAIFHGIDEEKRFIQLKGGERIMDFRDSYMFQIAAYKLSRMVGLENVPPAVKRTFAGTTGSVTFWVEGMITDEMRRAENREPTGEDEVRWGRQMAIMLVWDALIFNFDRNQGNILLDNNWNVWLIDHTRSFRRSDDITKQLKSIGSCERRLFESIRALNRQDVEQQVKGYLRPGEIENLFKRREQLVAHLEKLARERGEDKVFFTYP